jgi:hypothetical protein
MHSRFFYASSSIRLTFWIEILYSRPVVTVTWDQPPTGPCAATTAEEVDYRGTDFYFSLSSPVNALVTFQSFFSRSLSVLFFSCVRSDLHCPLLFFAFAVALRSASTSSLCPDPLCASSLPGAPSFTLFLWDQNLQIPFALLLCLLLLHPHLMSSFSIVPALSHESRLPNSLPFSALCSSLLS